VFVLWTLLFKAATLKNEQAIKSQQSTTFTPKFFPFHPLRSHSGHRKALCTK